MEPILLPVAYLCGSTPLFSCVQCSTPQGYDNVCISLNTETVSIFAVRARAAVDIVLEVLVLIYKSFFVVYTEE